MDTLGFAGSLILVVVAFRYRRRRRLASLTTRRRREPTAHDDGAELWDGGGALEFLPVRATSCMYFRTHPPTPCVAQTYLFNPSTERQLCAYAGKP
jgi:hypothetical protein